MKRNNNLKPLSAIIEIFLQETKLDQKLLKHKIEESWFKVVDKDISNHTTRVYFESGILTVLMDNSVLKQELNFKKQNLLQEINKILGSNSIRDLHIY